ncbi:MAG TPA: prohead protease/major capsid protein fusion protein, partial [Steroidobacter sp.]|nr:prohead protease/major capsid protein fusion protein [Steroidobacter sp.]
RAVVGVVERAWITKGEGRALVRFSDRDEVQDVVRDVQSGVLRNISVGYTVHRYEVTKEAGSQIDTYRAVDWEPMEISIVPIGFDDGAKIRSGERPKTHKVQIINRGTRKMNDQTDNIETGDDIIEPATPGTRAAVLQAERARTSTILTLCRNGGLGNDFASALITDGVPLEKARVAIIDEMADVQSRTQPNTRSQHLGGYSIGEDFTDPAHIVRTAGEALFARMTGTAPSDAARPYFGRSLSEVARECLHLRGVRTRSMSNTTIVTTALERGYHGTSDFTAILGDAVNRTLMAAYESAEAGVVQAATQVTASDFKNRYPLRLGDAPKLEKVNEHGEFRFGTIQESAEAAWKLDTFGKIFSITRQAIINDDLGAFANIPAKFGVIAREFESAQVVALLTSAAGVGPTMSDGNPLFHTASHGNLIASGTVIDVTSLGTARKNMRLQKNMDGRVVNITPRWLLVPAALETVAEQVLTAIDATKSSDVNPFPAKLKHIVEPRLDAISSTAWYLIGDQTSGGLEVAHLAGSEGPQVETETGFIVDGVSFKVRLDFGCGFTDWRSWLKNPGAAPG